ncbi:glutamic acid-rich protein [Histomonas meleagridis]|uniref:glutamic acid-rich protein n=1 Tax=Histomonas meleagridis TaxID=135588 RepID=UPI00355987EA|nr:glutamic acid-rich protein [Histomonas meleagridis]KAH0798524.1 glutamic acid-rich protein [Histomonas meleagridis]
MTEENVSFVIPVKPKVEKSPKQAVSSMFTKPKSTISNSTQNEPKISFKKKVKAKHAPTRNVVQQGEKESSFLTLLKQRQKGIAPPPPVPTQNAINSNVHVGGFGEIALRMQGWEPGMPIGSDTTIHPKKRKPKADPDPSN